MLTLWRHLEPQQVELSLGHERGQERLIDRDLVIESDHAEDAIQGFRPCYRSEDFLQPRSR